MKSADFVARQNFLTRGPLPAVPPAVHESLSELGGAPVEPASMLRWTTKPVKADELRHSRPSKQSSRTHEGEC